MREAFLMFSKKVFPEGLRQIESEIDYIGFVGIRKIFPIEEPNHESLPKETLREEDYEVDAEINENVPYRNYIDDDMEYGDQLDVYGPLDD
ncbi:hypothetical protein LXL04_029113 [Taraxacum kok-saghyz]